MNIEKLQLKGYTVQESFLNLEVNIKSYKKDIQELQAKRNTAASLYAKTRPTEEQKAEMREINIKIENLTKELNTLEIEYKNEALIIPNAPHDSVPVGDGPEHNPVIRQWGKTDGFSKKGHLEICGGMIDLEAGNRIAGPAFPVLRGAIAKYQRSVENYLLDKAAENGYEEISVPLLMKKECAIGTGQLPKFNEQLYHVENHVLLPTAEVPLTNLYRDMILNELPPAICALTPCFRQEAGAAGLGTRGLIRSHQFNKVELVRFCKPEEGLNELNKLVSHVEEMLKDLNLTHRVIELCTGDLGFAACKTYDIELWSPGQNSWLEVSSCSLFGDFQSKRMNLRIKGSDKNYSPYTLNGSGTALPRLMVALLEQNENSGQVAIPDKLQNYYNKNVL